MTPTPLPLTVRSQDDLTQQQHMHRVTALARSLIGSHTVMPLRAAQPAPNAPQRGNTAGSAEAEKLDTLRRRHYTAHLERIRYRRAGNPAQAEIWGRKITLLEAQMQSLAAQLEEVATRSAPAGLPYLYRVDVAGLEVTGDLPATYAPEVWTLDTRTLPEELHGRLSAYLLGGREALPYKYKRTRARYWPNSDAREEDRALMVTLWGHAQQQLCIESPGKHHADPPKADKFGNPVA